MGVHAPWPRRYTRDKQNGRRVQGWNSTGESSLTSHRSYQPNHVRSRLTSNLVGRTSSTKPAVFERKP